MLLQLVQTEKCSKLQQQNITKQIYRNETSTQRIFWAMQQSKYNWFWYQNLAQKFYNSYGILNIFLHIA